MAIEVSQITVSNAGLVCTALGLTVGHLVAAKRLKDRYQRSADQQIEEVKLRYTIPRIMPDADKPALSDLAGQALEDAVALEVVEQIAQDNGYVAYDKVEPVVEIVAPVHEENLVQRNIFESPDPDTYFDPEEEAIRRVNRPMEPYVITEAEFNDNDTEFTQAQLTYFDEDDVLVDDQDQSVPISNTVTDENLLRFGNATNDPNVVYVRNEKLEVDFEVTKSTGRYAEVVHGFIEHSDKPRVNRMRPERN